MIISTGASRKALTWTPEEIDWETLVERMRTPTRTRETCAEYQGMDRDQRQAAKDIGGFVGGRLENGSRSAENVLERWLVALDADFGDLSMLDAFELMLGCRGLAHSTHSYTRDNPRLRFILPLTRPVSAAEYEPVARWIAWTIDPTLDAFDDTTFEVNRLMFWPSVPKDGEYVFRVFDGPALDPDTALRQLGDWRDMRNWPTSSRQAKIVHRMADKAGDPLTKPGIVGAFNRAYSISAAIAKFLPDVYAPCGPDRYTYLGGTTVGGAVVYDNDTFLYSHHDTDPVSRRLCNAFDLIRLHKFGALDHGDEDSLQDTPSQQAMREMCADDEAVIAEFDKAIRERPEDYFEDDMSLQDFAGDYTEQGIARGFCQTYGGGLKYNSALGWLFWDGMRWQTNAEPEAHMLIMRYADDVYAQARRGMETAEDKKAAKAYMAAVVRLRTARGLNAVATISKAILSDEQTNSFDARAWELNTPGGIVDLHTGDLRAHDRESKHTKLTACSPAAPGTLDDLSDPAVRMWDGFLDHITAGDTAFREYLQTLAGMAAVGEVLEEGLAICCGPGGNGKSTFWGALRQVLGDYAWTSTADLLVQANGSHSGDPSQVARLKGARLVIMSETEEGEKLSASSMKRLTSRDAINGRMLYKEPIEFTPVHTCVMHTNHLPKLKSLDGGTLRRLTVVPFPATLPPEKVITNYEQRLVDQCGAVILRWIVEGAARFYRAGCKLAKPACVLAATQGYLEQEDWLQQFIDDNCKVDKREAVNVGQLYQLYTRWATEQGEKYLRGRNDFARAMETKGYTREKRRLNGAAPVWYWMGIGVEDGTFPD